MGSHGSVAAAAAPRRCADRGPRRHRTRALARTRARACTCRCRSALRKGVRRQRRERRHRAQGRCFRLATAHVAGGLECSGEARRGDLASETTQRRLKIGAYLLGSTVGSCSRAPNANALFGHTGTAPYCAHRPQLNGAKARKGDQRPKPVQPTLARSSVQRKLTTARAM